jgi:hypothetical protein
MSLLGVSYACAAELPEKSIAGTYEILVCHGSCASADDKEVLVKGRLVLFATNLQQQELTRLQLRGRYMNGEMPNGCFALERLSGRDYRGYAGIDKAGLTAWSIEDARLRFSLYRSPDAGYKVTAKLATTGFAGMGRSWGAGVAAPKESTLDHVVLRRTGAAKLSQCPHGVD